MAYTKKTVEDAHVTDRSTAISDLIHHDAHDVFQLIADSLSLSEFDPVLLVEQLLENMPDKPLRCTMVNGQLELQLNGDQSLIYDGSIKGLKGRMRAVCARLATLSQDTTGSDSFLYGGEGDIQMSVKGSPISFHVRTMNTTAEQWFEIHPLSSRP